MSECRAAPHRDRKKVVIYYNNNTLHEYNYNCYVVYKSSCKTYSFLDGAAGREGELSE